jgi:hypothetical protein
VLARLNAVLQQHRLTLASTDVRAEIVPSGTAWALSLDVQVSGERRVRRLSAESCEDLADATAVALLLLLEPLSHGGVLPLAASREQPAPTQIAPVPVPVSEPASVDEPAAEPEPDSELDARWTLGGAAVVDSSTLSAPALGGQVQTQLRVSSWSLVGFGLVLPAQRKSVGLGEFVELSQWSAGLRACHAPWATGSARVEACLGAELGRFSARGTGLSRTRAEANDWWLAPSAGARGSWHALPHAALLGGVEAVLPILRHSYAVNSTPAAVNAEFEAHETPAVTLRAWLGLEFDLL